MKKLKTFTLLILAVLTLQGCCWYGDCNDDIGDDIIEPFQSAYEPVYMSREDFEASITVADPSSVETAGKIYVIGQFLFINDVLKGFHVYNNQNPSSPNNLSFLNAPGSTDLSIKNDIYYINQATDLVAVRFNPLNGNPEVTKRIRNVFPPLTSPDGFIDTQTNENQVVVNWIIRN